MRSKHPICLMTIVICLILHSMMQIYAVALPQLLSRPSATYETNSYPSIFE